MRGNTRAKNTRAVRTPPTSKAKATVSYTYQRVPRPPGKKSVCVWSVPAPCEGSQGPRRLQTSAAAASRGRHVALLPLPSPAGPHLGQYLHSKQKEQACRGEEFKDVDTNTPRSVVPAASSGHTVPEGLGQGAHKHVAKLHCRLFGSVSWWQRSKFRGAC